MTVNGAADIQNLFNFCKQEVEFQNWSEMMT